MQLSGSVNVSTGFTPRGQLYIKTEKGGAAIIKTTRNPIKFLRMLCDIPDERRTIDHNAVRRQPFCYWCGGPAKRNGAKIGNECFCMDCYAAHNHLEYYRINTDWTAYEINLYTSENTSFL